MTGEPLRIERYLCAGRQSADCGHVLAKGDVLIVVDPSRRSMCADCLDEIGRRGTRIEVVE